MSLNDLKSFLLLPHHNPLARMERSTSRTRVSATTEPPHLTKLMCGWLKPTLNSWRKNGLKSEDFS